MVCKIVGKQTFLRWRRIVHNLNVCCLQGLKHSSVQGSIHRFSVALCDIHFTNQTPTPMHMSKRVVGLSDRYQYSLTRSAIVQSKQSRETTADADAQLKRFENLSDARRAATLWDFCQLQGGFARHCLHEREQEQEGGSGSLQWYSHLLHPRQHINYRATLTQQHKSRKGSQ